MLDIKCLQVPSVIFGLNLEFQDGNRSGIVLTPWKPQTTLTMLAILNRLTF